MINTLEIVWNFRQSFNKWYIPVLSIFNFGHCKMNFLPKQYTRELHSSHNVCLWLVPSHFHQIKMSNTGVSIVFSKYSLIMMTSSNGNIFRVTGPLCGEFTGPGEFPTQRPVTRNYDVFFDLRLNKRLSKQPRGWWFDTPSWSLGRQCNDFCR